MANDSLILKVADKDVEIVMYAGLLSRIITTIGGIDNLPAIYVDTNVQEEVVKLCLQNYNEKGEVVSEKASVFTLDVDSYNKIIEFCGEHVSDFFIEKIQKAKQLQEKAEKLATKMGSNVSQAG